MTKIQEDLRTVLTAFMKACPVLLKGRIVVVGASTSEVAGAHIGKQGSLEIAAELYETLTSFAAEQEVALAFQCCEHLNRALVLERVVAQTRSWPEVSAVPARDAGGALATYAYTHMDAPVLVEAIQADAGIDIGDTLIGMHLKPVAVPVRVQQKMVGQAHVTLAYTRPKFIGGARACYE
ncbi:TIGR01440 family protein [Bacillus sp. FSL W7-1360]